MRVRFLFISRQVETSYRSTAHEAHPYFTVIYINFEKSDLIYDLAIYYNYEGKE